MTTRRSFAKLLGTAAAAWPMVARAQQAMPTIGFLHSGTRSSYSHLLAAIQQCADRFDEVLRDRGFGESPDDHYRVEALMPGMVAAQPPQIRLDGTFRSALLQWDLIDRPRRSNSE